MPLGELITRWTIRLALLLCAASLGVRIWGSQSEAASTTQLRAARIARTLWTLGFLLYLAHLGAAFTFHHGWSHAEAWQHTAERTDEVLGIEWGGGVWFNYAFTLAWAMDVAWLWRPSTTNEARPRWVMFAWYAWFLAIVLFATVVFEVGATRWVAVAVLFLLAAARVWSLRKRTADKRNLA